MSDPFHEEKPKSAGGLTTKDFEKCPICVPPETIISGDYVPISTIHERERCLGISGHVKVLKTFRRYYSGRMVHIDFGAPLPIRLTPDHPVLVITSSRSGLVKFEEPYWKSAKDITPKRRYKRGDYLLVPRLKGEIDLTELDLSCYTTHRGISIARAKGYLTTFPLNSQTAWLLGIYVAEGCTTKKGIVIYTGKHEEKMKSRILKIGRGLGYSPRVREARTAKAVEISSRILSRAFGDWCGKGAKNKRIPYFILYHKQEDIMRSFLDGYVEGDGNKNRNTTRIRTISLTLALQIQLLLARLGYLAKGQKIKSRNEAFIESRRIKEQDAYVVRWWPQAKMHKSGAILDEYIAYAVKEVKTVPYDGYVYNLETEDGTYLALNTVVHNCRAFLGLAEEAACRILKQVNPSLDVDACKSVLRMKLQGRPVEEIAGRLNVPEDVLLEVISKSAEMAGKALNTKKWGR